MGMIRRRRGWALRLVVTTVIATLVGPGPAAAWANARDAERAADARMEKWFSSLTESDEEPSNVSPRNPPGPSTLAGSRWAATADAVLPVPLQPKSVRLLSTRANIDPWALFDGKGSTGLHLSSSESMRLEINLQEPQALAALTLLGPTEGTLTVFSREGEELRPIPQLKQVPVRAGANEWLRLPVEDRTFVANLVLEWAPASASGPLEIGLWGRSLPLRDATDAELADRVLVGSAPGAFIAKATPDLVTASRVSLGAGAAAQRRDGVVRVRLSADPRSWSRAFLVYELTGLGHFTQAVRQINGLPSRGGARSLSEGPRLEGGLQVEEISPEWLRAGDNEIRFLPLSDAGAPEYSVRRVRLVGVGHSTLAEARMTSSGTNAARAAQFIALDRASQPHDLVFELLDRSQGQLLVRAADAKGRAPLRVDLRGLAKGWHRIDLGALPVTSGVSVALEGVPGGARTLAEGRLSAVSEVVVTASAVPELASAQRIGLSYPLHGECRDRQAWVQGFVVAERGNEVVALRANGEDVTASVGTDNSFALPLPQGGKKRPGSAWTAELEATLASGRVVKRTLRLDPCPEESDAKTAPGTDEGAPYEQLVRAGEKKTLSFAGARLEIPAGAVDRDVRISIRPLVAEQIPALSPRVKNTSPGKRAYRFGPHGLKFKKPVKLSLPYDKAALGVGEKEGQVLAFYYDEPLGSWQPIGRFDAAQAGSLTSLTEHFTDFITGVLATPDEPGLKSFNSSEMKGIKVADPAAGVSLVAPPSPNSSGTMNLRHPIELPPGRNGLEPSLAFTYNSAGGNGWMGLGWDLKVPSIEIDTRFGVPHYDDADDVRLDRYMLDGERLVPGSTSGSYVRRVEGSFDVIRRNVTPIGMKNCVTSWTVTDKRGTVYTYGGTGAVLVDPADACKVFRWGLSTVKDTFGNQMKVTYQPVVDSASGESAAALYPLSIDYTEHVNSGGVRTLAPAYRVSFVRDNGSVRKDVVISGRAGFQERTKYRLDHVDVSLVDGSTTTLIRRYQLTYHPPSLTHFYKSLLASIAQQGLGGVTQLDQHTFEYGEAATLPGNPAVIDGFSAPTTWGAAANNYGLSSVDDEMSGGSVTLGVGLPIISLTATGGGNSGSERTNRALLDLDSDGLPDFAGQSGAFMNFLRPQLSVSPFDPQNHLYPRAVSGLGTLGESRKSGWNVGGGVNLAGIVGLNAAYTSTDTDETDVMVDIDGDGRVDRARVLNGKLRWSKNNGNNAFALQPEPMNSSNTLLPNTKDPNGDFLAEATSSGLLARIAPLVRWKAPYSGSGGADLTVTIRGDIQKRFAGGNGVDVMLFKEGVLLWGRTFGPSDLTPCRPKQITSPGTLLVGECDAASPGLSVPIHEGQSLYFMTAPHHDPAGTVEQIGQEAAANQVAWDPQVSYDGMPATLEPYGLPVYTFSQKTDHRLYRPEVQWVASAKGTIKVRQSPWQADTLPSLAVSDNVTLSISHISNGAVVGTPISIAIPAGGRSAPFADQTINVEQGDSISIEATSSTPVDLERLGLDLWIQYSHYYRNLSDNTVYDGDVTCSPGVPPQPAQCVLTGDPELDSPIPSEILTQPINVHYKFNRLRGAATNATTFATAQTVTLAGTVSCFASSGINTAAAQVLVQGVHRLYSTQAVTFFDDGSGNGSGSGSVSLSGSATVDANGELMVTVFASPNVSCSGSGTSAPVNVRYLDPSFTALNSDNMPADPMSGGFHRWSAGFYNADISTGLDTSKIVFPLDASANPKHTPTWFFFGVPQHDEVPPTDRPAGRWSGPGGAYIAAGEFSATRGSARSSSGGGGGVDSLRHASTWNFELAGSITVLSFGVNEGRTKSDHDIFDFNGDRFADVVSADGTVQFGDGQGSFTPRGVAGITDLNGLREIHHGTVRVGIIGEDNHLITDTAPDGSVRKSISTGFSLGTDYGLSSTNTDWLDVNGDGLPDAVKRDPVGGAGGIHNYAVRLNYGYRLGPQISWPAHAWQHDSAGAVPGVAAALGINIDSAAIADLVNALDARVGINGVRMQDNASNNVTAGLSGGTGGVNVGAGGGFSFGFSRTLVDMVDVNGDGLPDQVLRVANDTDSLSGAPLLRVRLNLGDQFDTADTLWAMPAWGNIDDGGADFSFAGSIDNSLGFRRSKSFTANFHFKFCFIVCVGASAFKQNGTGWGYSGFQDVDGDGRPDMVFKNKSSGAVTVKLNQIPKDLNLLRKVNRPLGGSFEVAYDRAGNLVRTDLTPRQDAPGAKYVLAELQVSDGREGIDDGVHRYKSKFSYDPAGYHDRDEREDYGFSTVNTTRLRSDGSTHSSTEVSYQNQDFYRKGLVSRVVVRDATGGVFNVQSHDYAQSGYGTCTSGVPEKSAFPAETKRTTSYFEGTTTNPNDVPQVSTSEVRTWDCHGNLTDMADSGEAKDMTAAAASPANNDIRYHVDYDTTPTLLAANIHKPRRIVARDHFNKILRDRRATYEGHGALRTLTDVVIGGVDPLTGIPNTGDPATNPSWTYDYDEFGNVKQVVDPGGYALQYSFDPKTRSYRTLVEDSFGYASASIPDLRFGRTASEIDVNGSIIDFHFDEFGRLSSVDGPFDVGTSHHTIAFSYSQVGVPATPGAVANNPQPAFAITGHRDVQHPTQPVLTVAFADGLDRIIQTKKSLAVEGPSGVEVGMQVTGAVRYDDQGRLSAEDQPYFETPAQPTVMGSQLTPPATRTAYDVLDRVLEKKMPLAVNGGAGDPYIWATTATDYGIGTLNAAKRLVTTVFDANVSANANGASLPGAQRTVFRGVRGNILQIIETNHLTSSNVPSTLKTSFGYNALDELLAVTDAKGNVTRATYDTAGRLVTLVSPDMGRTDFQFDLSSNLAAKQTARMVDDWQFTRYEYEFNRLTKIDYPNSEDVLFEYGSPYEAGPLGLNRAGRLMQETSEAGTKSLKYDALGNINEEVWTLNRIGGGGDPIERTFQYDYDSFGRLLAVYYPGESAEVVSYGYDAGGNLDTVTGLTASRKRTEYVKHIGYDAFEQRVALTLGNGITTTYSYDPLTRRLAGVQASQRDPGLVSAGLPARPFQQLAYQYDPIGNVTQIANTAPFDPTQTGAVKVGPVTENFSYDDLYQLRQADGLHQTSATNRFHYGLSFSYDSISNITQKSQLSETQTLSGGVVTQTTTRPNQTYTSAYKYTSGRPHAPTEISDTVPSSSTPVVRAFDYDTNGNQTSWQRVTSPPSTRDLTYTDDNRLSGVTQDNVGLQTALYDAGGQRLVKRANESALTAYFGQYLTVREGNPTTKHIFAGATRVASKFVPNEANEECTSCPDHADVTYFHGDQLGSMTFATDETQTLLAHEQYFPSGELWVDQATDTAHTRQPYLFSGKELDVETGLYYFGARYYDPRIGIWTSPDPILAQYMRGQTNGGVYAPRNIGLYTYSWNNPVTFFDPNGAAVGEGFFTRTGKTLLGMGFGALKSVIPGSALIPQPKGTLANDSDFLAGQGVGEMTVGAYEMAAGATLAGGGGALEIGTLGGGSVVAVPAVVGGVALFGEGAADSARGVNTMQMSKKAAEREQAAAAGGGSGRTRGQERLKQIAEDPNTSSADKGWIKQEQNAIERGQRPTIRNPPGKQLAHTRGREAAKGYDHVESPSNLQDTDLHRTQHKYDNGGRANKERP